MGRAALRRIAVVTFGRSDYGACLPVARLVKADPGLDLYLIVSGMHLSPEFGYTVMEVEGDGLQVNERIEMLLSADTPGALAKSVGLGMIGFAQSFSRSKPDVLLLLGDRIELLSAASAALLFGIPIAHVSGGDVTEGAIDNQVRYAITRMSHLHFVAMQLHGERLIRMGEEPWRVHVTGDPALDVLSGMDLMRREKLSECLGVDLVAPVVVVTFHPTTLTSLSVSRELEAVLGALHRTNGTLIITYPNADPGGRCILERLKQFVLSHSGVHLFSSLGQQKYYSLLSHADAMIGNSSSGIWEAPSFRLPVVNVGERQKGRVRTRNVIDVEADAHAIYEALCVALSPAFRTSLDGVLNPYGNGKSASRIVEILRRVDLGPGLLQKRIEDTDLEKPSECSVG